MKHTMWRLAALVFLLALVVAACRADEDEPTEALPDDPDAVDEEPVDDEPDDDPVDDDPVDEEAMDVPGITEEPCPDGINEDNGCIYVGSLNDLTEGPFSAAGPLIQDAAEAFWRRVNEEEGGIGGYDVDISTYVRDNLYQPEVHSEVYQEIRNNIVAVGISLGSSPTIAVEEDLEADSMFAVPMAWNSDFIFSDIIAETGPNYCVDSMNAVDYYVDERGDIATIMSIHYPNDYGQDADVGVRIAAETHGAEHIGVQTPPGPENQGDAIQRIAAEQPDLVILTTNPTDAGAIVGESVAAGYDGFFIGHGPTYNVALLDSPAADAFLNFYWNVAPYAVYETDLPGYNAMREWLDLPEGILGNNFHVAGWVSQYPVKTALEAAAENDDLTREGILAAKQSLTAVEWEGTLPDEAGNYAGEPNERAVRASFLSQPDTEPESGVTNLELEFTGPTAQDYDFSEPCRDNY